MLPQKARGWLLVGCLALSLAGVAAARQVRLELNNGRAIIAELVDQDDASVTVTIAGIETTLPRERIARIDDHLSLEQTFEQRRDALADDDWRGRYELAQWAYDQKEERGYELALAELEQLLEQRPSHRHAELLQDLATEALEQAQQQRRQLEQRRAEPTPRVESISAIDSSHPSLLSDEDVAFIKAFEVRLRERPTVVVPRDVIDEIFERYRDHPAMRPFLGRRGQARFHRLPGYEQLGILFDLRAREYYDQVIFRTEPSTLRTFRMVYNRNYIARYCGQCHGDGPRSMNAPGLKLLTRRPVEEAPAYTNLMILRRTQVNGQPLIDPYDPLRSPLVQYGLPADDAETPHPQVRGWRPYFSNRRDPRIYDMVRWMQSLYGDGGDYPMEFELPELPGSEPSSETIGAADGDA